MCHTPRRLVVLPDMATRKGQEQVGSEPRTTAGWPLPTVVLIHLVISLVHGAAHPGARVSLTPARAMFVSIGILAGPLAGAGLAPAVADALDAGALRRVVVGAHPTHVIHQLTALPKGGPRSARDLVPTNRLRIEGTRNLIDAAVAAGAQRIIGGSFALLRNSNATTQTRRLEE